jgi:phosphoglycerol transferase MdoB-like AlkP superfamily enzyme
MGVISKSIRFHLVYYIFLLWNKAFFFFTNLNSFSLDKSTDIWSVLLGSFHYDFILIFLFWVIHWIVVLVNSAFPTVLIYQRVGYLFLVFLLFLYSIFNFLGAFFYKFNFELPSNRTLEIMWEHRNFLGGFIRLYFWYVIVFILSFIIIVYWIFNMLQIKDKWTYSFTINNHKKLALCFFVTTGILFYSIREFDQAGWLTPNSSFRFVKAKYRSLIVNPLFSFAYSYLKDTETDDLFINLLESDISFDLSKNDKKSSVFGQYKGKNIFLIIIESASEENFNQSSPSKFEMPFFDSLKKHSLYFSNAYANGYLSSDGIRAIYLGLGNLILDNRVKHPYVLDRDFLGNILQKQNYSTSLFYGSTVKAADYWKTVGYSGISEYFNPKAMNIVNPQVLEKDGVYDHAFFMTAAKKMAELREPFISGIANLSTHNPYNRFPNYSAYRNMSVSFLQAPSMLYFDDVLRKFFQTIQNYSWFNNTIFLFVGDHNSRADDLVFRSDWGLLKIPMMIYDPQESITGIRDYTVQQTDIPSTLLSMVGIDDDNLFSNRCMLDSTEKNRTFITRKGEFLLFGNDSLILKFDLIKKGQIGCWNYKIDPHLKNQLAIDSFLLKSFFQQLGYLKKQYRTLN